jgi:threonylcarbamoyladenosine tRNA methylthiotransferase MtaB
MHSVAFKTIGCRLNQADTAQISSQFQQAGYRVVPFGEACDVAVIHSCTITHQAERTCLKVSRQARRQGARVVVLAGCAVERDAAAVATASGADLVVGQAEKFQLPQRLAELDPTLAAPPDATDALAIGSTIPQFDQTRALVKIQDGCEFGCAYCIVPSTRSRIWSRPIDEIITEVTSLVAAGYREVVLTGANLGCYRDDSRTGDDDLITLLRQLDEVEGLLRLRLSSIESTTSERAVIRQMAASRTLCHFLHLPLQSGSDRILASMGRRYRRDDYRRTCELAIELMPYVGLGSDIIVGFPGETDTDFAATRQLVESLPFSNLHVFPYSARPGTRAYSMPDQVDHAVRKARAAELIALGATKRTTFARRHLGTPVDVLIEGVRDGACRGWSGNYLNVRIAGELPSNTLNRVIPQQLQGDILLAQLP